MRNQIVLALVAGSLAFSVAACAGSTVSVQPTQPARTVQPTQVPTPTKEPTATATSQQANAQFEDFDPNNFDRSTNITNPWLPLKPGTRFIYDGVAVNDKGNLVPHRIIVNVTDLTKMIGGVRAAVTWDEDYTDGKLAESELAFYAQDKDGNVWYMGEYPEAYENGTLVEALTWVQGIQDARAGIMMKSKPQLETPQYSEGWGPAVNWTDYAKVDQMGQKTCVPVKCYDNVMVIAETSQSEPDAQQLKYYVSGVGNVRVGWRGSGEKVKESLELTKIEQLSPDDVADVRAKALELEKSAYKTSKDVYAHTPPLEQSK